MDVTAAKENTTQKWDYRDSLLLENRDGSWYVYSFRRSATPWQYDSGSKTGWSVAATREGVSTWVSSFSELNPYIGFSWSDDGQYMAFGAENFDRTEVWTVKKDGSELRCVFSTPKDPGLHDGDRAYLQMVSWTPGQHKVVFLLSVLTGLWPTTSTGSPQESWSMILGTAQRMRSP